MVALEPRHVFDESQDRDVHFGKHGDSFASIDEGDFLGSCDDDGPGEGDALDDGELDVTRSWGEVEHENVEFTPSDLFEKLLGVAIGKRAAHDDWGRF